MINILQSRLIFLVLSASCLIAPSAYSQTKNRIAIISVISSNAVFTSQNLVGGGSHEGKGANAFGIRYSRYLSKSFAIETGLDYSSNRFETTPAFTGQQMPSSPHNIRMVSVPLYGNVTFLKYLFVNAGLSLDLETDMEAAETRSINSQSGVGYGLGVGGKYDFNKISVLVNPFFQKHAVLASSKQPERIGELGVKLGIGYNF